MVSIYKRPHGVYCIDYTVNGKRVRKSLGTRDPKLAERLFHRFQARYDEDKAGLLPRDISCEKFSEMYFE